jgi:hypothetical protein
MSDKKIDVNNDTSIIEFANEVVHYHQPKFKTKYFVGRSSLTPFKEMHQYMMELRTKQDAFLHCEWEEEKKKLEEQIEAEKLKKAEAGGADKLDIAYIRLDLLNIRKDMKKFKDNLNRALIEKDDILQLIRELDESPRGKLPDGTRILDIMDDKEKCEELEKEYWSLRLAKQAATEMLAYGKVGTGNIDAIAMLEPPQQKEVLEIAANYATRFDIGMAQIMDKTVNDLRIGYNSDNMKDKMLQIGIAEGLEREDLLKNKVEENNTLINNKYKELEKPNEGNKPDDSWSLKE